jgi:protein-tyrosine phosphatase
MEYAEIIHSLFLGPKPAEKDFDELKKVGITAVLCLLEDQEGAQKIKDLCQKYQLLYHQIPIPDAFHGGLPTPSQILEAVSKINEWLTTHHKVYVHCYEGRGRSPLLVTAYLCLKGNRLYAAINCVKRSWPRADPNAEQIEVLCKLLKNKNTTC